MKTTTPASISDHILRLCRSLNPAQEPRYVLVKPWNKGRADQCFYNIKAKIQAEGGAVQYGWTIWENPRILIEAEFHAVWVSPDNELIDITPKIDGEPQILFLPDCNRVWQGEMIDNVRVPLVDNQYTRKLIRESEALFRLRKKHWKDGVSEIPLDEVLRFQQQLRGVNGELPTLARKIGRNDPCHCGSGIKYKKCCLKT